MYSYEDRIRAVELCIKLDKRVKTTIRQPGYRTRNALNGWYREYEQRLDRKLQASLTRQCVTISEKVVQRLMKQERLVVAGPNRRLYGSCLGEISPAPGNLVNRDFQAAAPNEKLE